MKPELQQQLEQFHTVHQISGKGKLSVVLHLTRLAKKQGLPLIAEELRTGNSGQVKGQSRSTVQAILADYGITRVLAQEGGRTSRGGLGAMERYVSFLNELHQHGLADLDEIERWWVERVKDFFASKPFTLRYDVSQSLREMVNNLLKQARQRQSENTGTTYLGSLLQHLVGAKLELVLKERDIEIIHHGASVADAPTAREGDFVIDKTIIHVTALPTEQLLEKCKRNLESGRRPIIVTLNNMMAAAESNAELLGIAGRVDILAVDQFLAANLHELSGFQEKTREATIEALVDEYNRIISSHETDPSLQIRMD